MSLQYSAVVGKKEDWANVVTNVSMIDTPFLGWIPVGKNPVQAERLYQADVYDAPAENTHADGVVVTNAKSAGRNRVQLRSLIQYSTKAASVTKLTQDYGNQAGVSDELGTEIAKQTKELSRDIEAACLSAQECVVGVSGTTGYKTRGVPNWVQTSAQATYPVDASVRPATAQVNTTATGSLTEDVILDILQGIASVKRSSQTVTAFVGPSGKRLINNFPMFTPSSNSTLNAGAYPSPIRGGVIDRGIDRYNSDFGFVDFIVSYNNHALDSTATYKTHSAFFLHQDMWELAWGDKPNWVQKPYEGGKMEAFCEAIWMLTCWNPAGEGKWAPAT